MTELFKKLDVGNVDEILILNEPEGFAEELDKLDDVIVRESVIRTSEIDFALIFVTEQKQIQNRIQTVYPKLIGNAVLWFAIPTDLSKTKLSVTEGWGVLGDYNLKQIDAKNVNDDWFGIRFQKIEFLKKEDHTVKNYLN